MRGLSAVHTLLLLAVALAVVPVASPAQKGDGVWPRVIVNETGTITVYQPQIESFNDVSLEARAAVSVKPPKKDPVFGAVWFHARTTVNRDARTVLLDSTQVTHIKFPNATPEQEVWLKSVIDAEIPNWGSYISYDVLVAQLALAGAAASRSSTACCHRATSGTSTSTDCSTSAAATTR